MGLFLGILTLFPLRAGAGDAVAGAGEETELGLVRQIQPETRPGQEAEVRIWGDLGLFWGSWEPFWESRGCFGGSFGVFGPLWVGFFGGFWG